MGNNILIVGGAGFIGSNLIRSLLAQKAGGGTFRILDNLSAGRAADVQDLPVELLVGDIRDEGMVERAVQGMNMVVHLAAHTSVIDSVQEPEVNMEINVKGLLNLLRASVKHKVERFVFASTGGAIIGDVEPPVHEDMVPHPVSPYGASKLAGEGYCSAFYGSYGLKTCSLRFSNIYGPFSYHKGSVIATFFKNIQANKDLTIFGDGEQTRDFLYVADLCQAIIASLTSEVPFGEAVQLGTGQPTSINRLVEIMRQVVGPEVFPAVQYAPVRAGEVLRNYCAIDRARQFLNFHPTTGLPEGLQATWNWFQGLA